MSQHTTIALKSGQERFHAGGKALDFDIHQFWRWSASDLMNNRMRGLLAEYLVVQAVGVSDRPRVEWDAYDAITPGGIRVEVKSAAYVQSWHQTKPSTIKFDIRPTRAWFAHSNQYAETVKRQADVYVFCLLGEKGRTDVDPLDVTQWRFFVLETRRLNATIGDQKTIGLRPLLALGADEVPYASLAKRVAATGALPR